MIVKLLTEYHLEFLSFKGGCRGSSSLHMSKWHIAGNHYAVTGTIVDGLGKVHQDSTNIKQRRNDKAGFPGVIPQTSKQNTVHTANCLVSETSEAFFV